MSAEITSSSVSLKRLFGTPPAVRHAAEVQLVTKFEHHALRGLLSDAGNAHQQLDRARNESRRQIACRQSTERLDRKARPIPLTVINFSEKGLVGGSEEAEHAKVHRLANMRVIWS